MVKLSFGSRLASYEPVMSRCFASLMLGRFSVELQVDDSSSTICVKLYVANAVMLVQQVVCGHESRQIL